MRLNKSQKEAFVRSVMHDIPEIDYDEQAQKIGIAALEKLIPKNVQEFAAKNPSWIQRHAYGTPRHLRDIYFICPETYSDLEHRLIQKDAEAWAKLVELGELAEKQKDERSKIRSKLTGIIESCSTLGAAKKRLPEFGKYLPSEANVATANLPVANLIADLNRMGWPKTKTKENK